MTPQQKIYFDAIRNYIQTNGCSPSYQEIGKMVGVHSLASVHKMVQRLVAQGYLLKSPHGGGRKLNLVPGKIAGLSKCDLGHSLIYYLDELCPLCQEIHKHSPPKEVFAS